MDAICRRSQAKNGGLDKFGPRFAVRLPETTSLLLKCPAADLPALERLLRLWRDNGVVRASADGNGGAGDSSSYSSEKRERSSIPAPRTPPGNPPPENRIPTSRPSFMAPPVMPAPNVVGMGMGIGMGMGFGGMPPQMSMPNAMGLPPPPGGMGLPPPMIGGPPPPMLGGGLSGGLPPGPQAGALRMPPHLMSGGGGGAPPPPPALTVDLNFNYDDDVPAHDDAINDAKRRRLEQERRVNDPQAAQQQQQRGTGGSGPSGGGAPPLPEVLAQLQSVLNYPDALEQLLNAANLTIDDLIRLLEPAATPDVQFQLRVAKTALASRQQEIVERNGEKFIVKLSCTVYIGNLAPTVTEDELRKMLSRFGRIVGLVYRADSGQAFVTFEKRTDAEQCQIEMMNLPVHNKPVRTGWARGPDMDKNTDFDRKVGKGFFPIK